MLTGKGAFLAVAFANLNWPVAGIRIQSSKDARFSQKFDAIVHAGKLMRVCEVYSAKVSLADTKSERIFLPWKDECACPPGRGGFYDVVFHQSVYFICNALHGNWPSSIRCSVYRSGIIRG